MKNLIGIAVLGLALVLGGYGCKKEEAQQSDKRADEDKKPDHKVKIEINSTTLVTPGAAGNSSAPTIITLTDNNAYVFFYGSTTTSVARFDYDNTKAQVSGPVTVGAWSRYTLSRLVKNEAVQVGIFVNYDANSQHFFDPPVIELPNAPTLSVYVADYTSTPAHAAHGNATIIAGDVNLFP